MRLRITGTSNGQYVIGVREREKQRIDTVHCSQCEEHCVYVGANGDGLSLRIGPYIPILWSCRISYSRTFFDDRNVAQVAPSHQTNGSVELKKRGLQIEDCINIVWEPFVVVLIIVFVCIRGESN